MNGAWATRRAMFWHWLRCGADMYTTDATADHGGITARCVFCGFIVRYVERGTIAAPPPPPKSDDHGTRVGS